MYIWNIQFEIMDFIGLHPPKNVFCIRIFNQFLVDQKYFLNVTVIHAYRLFTSELF